MLDPPPHIDPARKDVLNLYIALGAGLLLSCWPHITAAFLSLGFFAGVLIAAYFFRAKQEDGSLGENHATFIIRTIWIGSLVALITVTAGSFYMLETVDSAPLMACAEKVAGGGISPDMNVKAAAHMLQPCIDNFISMNFRPLAISAMIVIGPVLLYFALRFVRGFTRALKGYRLAEPKAWF